MHEDNKRDAFVGFAALGRSFVAIERSLFCSTLYKGHHNQLLSPPTHRAALPPSPPEHEEIKSNYNIHTINYHNNYSFAKFLHNISNNNSQNK